MNTEWEGGSATFITPGGFASPSGTYGDGTTGVNLEQLFINGSYSRKINATSSYGVSLIFAYQRFEAKGLGTFGDFGLSSDPTKLTNNGTDTSTGFGAKLGWQGEVMPALVLGVSYQTKMRMSEFDDYAGLFAEQGGFDIPATWTIGLSYTLQNKSKIVFDVQQIKYSDVKSVGNSMMPALQQCTFGDSSKCLGEDGGPGFGWDDMTIFKIGYQWMMPNMPSWVWRVGYSKGDQPIPDSEVLFNILAPGVIEQHLTFGFTRDLGSKTEFNFAFMYALENSVKGPNPLDPAQEIELEMSQFELEASYSKKF
jgi:long-chain fatty acid transport protein